MTELRQIGAFSANVPDVPDVPGRLELQRETKKKEERGLRGQYRAIGNIGNIGNTTQLDLPLTAPSRWCSCPPRSCLEIVGERDENDRCRRGLCRAVEMLRTRRLEENR